MKRRPSFERAPDCALAAALVIAGIQPALAQDIALEVNAGAGQSDNIRRAASDEQSETIGSLGVKFSLDHRSSRLDADVVANLAYHDYLENTYDGELLGNFAGSSTFGIVDERLDWVLTDNFGQVLTDPFAPPTPETRENLNFLSTGPELQLPIGSQTVVNAGARYMLADFQDSPFDLNGVSASLGVARLISASSSVGFNAKAEQFDYDVQALNADYDQTEAFASFAAQGVRTNLDVDLGYSSIDRDAAEQKEDGLLARIDASRRVGTRSVLDLRLGQEFANSATSFASRQSGASIGLETIPGRQTAQPSRDRYVTLGWSTSGTRTRFGVSGDWREQAYSSQSGLDQTLTSLSANASRDLSPTVSIDVGVGSGRGSFDQPGGDYEELRGSLRLEWRHSRRFLTQLSFDYLDRSSDAAVGDFSESRIWLTFGYRHGVPRAGMRGPEFASDRVRAEY